MLDAVQPRQYILREMLVLLGPKGCTTEGSSCWIKCAVLTASYAVRMSISATSAWEFASQWWVCFIKEAYSISQLSSRGLSSISLPHETFVSIFV